MRILKSRWLALSMVLLLGGTVSAEVTQKVELHLVPSSNPTSAYAMDVVTSIATDDEFPELLELRISPAYDFVGIQEPNLDGEMRITTPASIDAAEDGDALAATHEAKTWSWLVHPGKARTIRMRYRILVTHDALLPELSRRMYELFLYFVHKDHGMIGTQMILATTANAPVNRTLARIVTPSGLEVHSPWPIAKDVHREGEIWYELPPHVLQDDGSDYLPLGTWMGPSLTTGDVQFSMLFPPEAEPFEQRLRQSLQNIMDYGVRLFAAPSQRNLMFAFRMGQPGSRIIGGTVKDNTAYIVFDPKRAEVEPESLTHVIAHEFMHLWGDRSRIAQVEEMRWLYEGFTDYYASQVCSRLDLVPQGGFAKHFVENTEKAIRSPVRGRWSIAEAGPKGLQGDSDSTELAYSGGWVLAAWLDAAIRSEAMVRRKSLNFAPLDGDVAKPDTLDELLREFYNDPQWTDENLPTPNLFLERLAKYLPPEQIAKFERFTTEVWAFDPVREFPLVGVPVNSRRVPAERLGVILGQGNMMVQRLAPGEAGESFGLRVGDELLRVNGQSSTSPVDIAWQKSGDGETEIVVRRDGKEEVLRGKKPTVEQLQVDPTLLLR